MSSLHQDRSLAEGSTPADARRSTGENAPQLPTQRPGKAQRPEVTETVAAGRKPGTTAGITAGTRRVPRPKHAAPVEPLTVRAVSVGAATTKVAAKAAGKVAGKVAAKAATTTAATAKAATRKAATATKAAAAARSASRAAARTATTATTTAVKPTPVGKPAAPKPTPVGKPAAPKATPAPKPAAAKATPAPKPAAATAPTPAPKETPAPKPAPATALTPAPRATPASEPSIATNTSVPTKAPAGLVVVVKDAPARVDTRPDVVEVRPTEAVVALVGGRGHRFAARRRPALVLAAALVGALGVSVLAGEGPTAQAGTTTASASVSVAHRLGLTGQPDGPVTDADTARLGELAASRNERDAEQVAAAKAQDAANHAAAQAAAEAARPDAVLPVKGARLTSGFGGRWGRLHAGIDLAAPMLTPEYAVMDGIVLEAGPSSGYGNAVYIQHHNGDVTVYGHMEKILVEAGQVVRAGDTIALLGDRGHSTGPHLHFEVHVGGLNGTKVDPIPWLRKRGINL